MGFQTFSPFLTILLPFILASSSHSFCPTTTCKNDTLLPIRFPFHLKEQQPDNCSYPGFDLHCTDLGRTTISLPHAGEFLVRHINYETQHILLHDTNNCLPRKLLEGFDPSGSPFQADFYVNYTFFSCPARFENARYAVISCLSNSTRSVIAISSHDDTTAEVSESCQVIRSLLVPVVSSNNGDFTSGLSDDVWLSWFLPDCKECEARGGICGFHSNGNQQIGCFTDLRHSGDPEQTENSTGLKIFRIIAFSIAVPAIACAVGVGVFLCIMDRRDRRRGAQVNRALEQIAGTGQPLDTTMGLDQATIDSYTKVVVGESRRIPGVNDGSCPICLSDYSAKETLRCIPDCQHCFHADCIDEWLKMKGTCPVCRTTPADHAEV
ncbi:putative RING-H2 finger protein ATL21A [Bienertia sinuspersici]